MAKQIEVRGAAAVNRGAGGRFAVCASVLSRSRRRQRSPVAAKPVQGLVVEPVQLGVAPQVAVEPIVVRERCDQRNAEYARHGVKAAFASPQPGDQRSEPGHEQQQARVAIAAGAPRVAVALCAEFGATSAIDGLG